MKKVLVVGASGATGRLCVKELLDRGNEVTVIVRSISSLPDSIKNHDNLSEIQADVHELSDSEMVQYIKGCDVIISCLGHNLTFKGIFGHPRLLVTNTVKSICAAIQSMHLNKSVKLILMNTTGNSNRDIQEKTPPSQKFVILLLRLLLPPHVDNEKAADFLRVDIGRKNRLIEWVIVRPDSLINADHVTAYTLHPSPIRNPIFDAGSTSRNNVGHFMAELANNEETWNEWKGQMPVIYNKT